MPPDMPATLSVDGSCDQRTGRAGAAAILTLPNGDTHQATETITTTKPSDAEIHALKIGLKLAARHQVTELLVYSDNQPITDAINGYARFPQEHHEHLTALLERIPSIEAVHVDRDDNPAHLHARVARRVRRR